MTQDTPALEAQVISRLRALGQTIVTAESSTGGLIAKRLTDISGSSACVLGGVVSYADEIKEKVLGVQKQTLIDYGAVSEPVAQQMAEGARRLFGTDFALSVTGIAGPGGGSAEKPVTITPGAIGDTPALHHPSPPRIVVIPSTIARWTGRARFSSTIVRGTRTPTTSEDFRRSSTGFRPAR